MNPAHQQWEYSQATLTLISVHHMLEQAVTTTEFDLYMIRIGPKMTQIHQMILILVLLMKIRNMIYFLIFGTTTIIFSGELHYDTTKGCSYCI